MLKASTSEEGQLNTKTQEEKLLALLVGQRRINEIY